MPVTVGQPISDHTVQAYVRGEPAPVVFDLSEHRGSWVVLVFSAAAVAQVVFGLPFAMAPLLAGACVIGFVTQSAKICIDTIVQEEIDDDFRGRVFSFYDTLFNLTFVLAAVLAAFVLPKDGKSYPVLVAIGLGYALTALLYGAAERRGRPARVSARSAAEAG